jgi:hypothetical protein
MLRGEWNFLMTMIKERKYQVEYENDTSLNTNLAPTRTKESTGYLHTSKNIPIFGKRKEGWHADERQGLEASKP